MVLLECNRPGMRSWTVYTPEFPTPVNEEDSREKLSPIQVLLVGNFYVNAVSEDRAAQVNKVHGTTIKAGQQGCRFNSQEMEKHSRNTMYPKSQQHPIYQLAYGGGHKEERKHTELGNLWWTGTCLETGQAIGTVGTCGEQVTSPASKRRPYRSWLVRLFQWNHLAGVQLQQHAMKVKSIPLKNFENIFTWYVH